jgi:hypothetical protein
MNDGKTYEGSREVRVVRYTRVNGERTPIYQNQQYTVTVNSQPLDPHYEVINYTQGFSETFEWGNNGGRGEYQLAVAILTDAYGPSVATRNVTQFAREVVRKLRDDWTLTEGEVFAYVLGFEMETRDAPSYTVPENPSGLPYQPSSSVLAGCGVPPAMIGLPKRKRRTRKPKQAQTSVPPIPLAVAV